MELADLIALARLPLNRRRLVEAVHLADAVDGRLATALESLGSPESSVMLRQHAAAALDMAQRAGITPVAWDAADYPSALRTIPDPPLVLWSLARRSLSLAAFEAADRYTVNVLSSTQIDIARRFSRPRAVVVVARRQRVAPRRTACGIVYP